MRLVVDEEIACKLESEKMLRYSGASISRIRQVPSLSIALRIVLALLFFTEASPSRIVANKTILFPLSVLGLSFWEIAIYKPRLIINAPWTWGEYKGSSGRCSGWGYWGPTSEENGGIHMLCRGITLSSTHVYCAAVYDYKACGILACRRQ